MDLLFKRYANPYLMLDEIILSNRLHDFVNEIVMITQEEKIWQFYLHKVTDKSYQDFREDLEKNNKQSMSKKQIEATVKHSQMILEGFTPNDKGVE